MEQQRQLEMLREQLEALNSLKEAQQAAHIAAQQQDPQASGSVFLQSLVTLLDPAAAAAANGGGGGDSDDDVS